MALETTYRDGLQSDTTYLIGQTMEGETILLPKQMMEQANVITIGENELLEDAVGRESALDIQEDEDGPSSPIRGTFDMPAVGYASRGNLVTCVTGSFD